MEETRIVGHLPAVTVEITHRQAEDGNAEHMTIHLTAAPSFRAAGDMLLSNPMALWGTIAQVWLSPWAALISGNPLLNNQADWKPLIQK